VTISAPDASIARAIVSLSRYFPVPTMRREWKRAPADGERHVRIVSTAVVIALTLLRRNAPADRVARRDRHRGEPRTPHDRAVVLHDDGARVERERLSSAATSRPRHRARLAVTVTSDRVVHLFSSWTIRRAASAGSAACHSALIAATP